MRHSPLLTYVPKGIGRLENFYGLQGFKVGQNDSAFEEGCDLEELKNLSNLRDLKIHRLERAERGASVLANKTSLRDLVLAWIPPRKEGEDDNGGGDDAKANEEADGESEDAEEDEKEEKDDIDDGNDDDFSGQANECEEAEEDENEEKDDIDDGNDDDFSGQANENEEAEENENQEAESEKEQKRWSEEQISKAERICNEMAQPSSTLSYILFFGYPGRQLPTWMTSSSLFESFPNLSYLRLVIFPCCPALPPLGTLPQLKYLRIQGASTITAIGSQFLGSRSSAFPKLEVLDFKDMLAWEEWTFNGTPLAVKLFPSLRDCLIINCPKLRALPDGLHRATNLNELFLSRTYELGAIDNLTLAYKLDVKNGTVLKKISNIPSLRYLEVNVCPELECVENLGKLQHLAVSCSEEMEQLPQWLPGLIEQHNSAASTHRSLRKFEVQCNLQLLKSCLQGNENWGIIQQIPHVKV